VAVVADHVDDPVSMSDYRKDLSARLTGEGSTKSQVAPLSRLRARPQFVPANTARLFIAICQPEGLLAALKVLQVRVWSPECPPSSVAPPSSLMLIPDCGFTRPSKKDVT
jgi:hypothetical protein